MKNAETSDVIKTVIEPRIELCGYTECTVEGIRSIPVYNRDSIKLDLGKFSVTFFGDELYITSFTQEGALIGGTIVSLEFEGNG